MTTSTVQHAELPRNEHDQNVQLRALADSLPQLVWTADNAGVVSYYNAKRRDYYEGNAADNSKLQWQPLIHSDDLPDTLRVWQTSREQGTDYETEHRLRMADGSYRWHLSRATAMRGTDGEISMWFGTATDIEKLKQAEFHMQSGAERLQVATEVAFMFAWEMNFKTETMSWADNASQVIGCSKEDLGSRATDGNFFVHDDDKQRIIADFNRFWQNGSDRFEMDFRGKPRNGRPAFWRTAGKFIRGRNGEPERAIGVTQDVSRHVEAAAQVKLLDERLAAAEEGAGALVYDWDMVEDRMWRSNSLTRILGWAPDELPAGLKGWRSLMHPDDQARFSSMNEESLLDATDHFSIEYRIRHKDGRYRWMMDAGRAFRDEKGRLIRQAGTTIDITTRKTSDHAQQRMATLIDLSFEPIVVWHPQRGILEWNRGAEVLYGFDKQDVIGKSPHDVLKTRSPVGITEIMQQLRTNASWAGVLENTANNGAIIVVESRYQLIEFDGDAVVLETNRDIRESRRADSNMWRMAAVASASHDALYGADLHGVIDAWNPGAELLFGYSEKEALGQNISMLANETKYGEQISNLDRVGRGETIKPFDAVRQTKDGRSIDVSMAISPVSGREGQVTGISVAMHDISERKEWDKRQRLMNRELAHRVKNSFAVLQAILRSTLKSSPEPQQFAAAFSGRLHSMAAAHDVLTANDWRGAELGALLRHQLSNYLSGQRIHMTGSAINLAAEQAQPLSLIFNELATNAIKYGALSTPQGRIDIEWQLVKVQDNEDIVELYWAETGGPVITKVGPRGFGTTLIERSLGGATVDINFPPEGFKLKLTWAAGNEIT